EDTFALLTGTFLVALGVLLYASAGLITGSTAGLAFLVNYLTPYGFGLALFVINLPFYGLAITRMGWAFTLRTFCAVGLIAVFAELTPLWIDVTAIHPVYASLMGGSLMGVGLLILFRHRASLGGINILGLYLQGRLGIRAGNVQMGVDLAILGLALFLLPWPRVLLSVLGAASMNLILTLNHKPGRYVGVS
ncbi:MAG: YitT family protein, partial [Natronospirillum sp.]